MENSSNINQEHSKIYRSRAQRIIGGVCGGIAEYFNIDVLLVRLAWIFATLFGGAGIIGYIVCLILIPDNPEQGPIEKKRGKPGEATKFWGIFLIILGAVFFIQQTGVFYRFHYWHIHWQAILAAAFISLGLYLLFNRKKYPHGNEKDEQKEAKDPPRDRPFYRIEKGKMLSGVCTGLSVYFDIDVTIIRLLWVFITLISAGVGIFAYLAAIIIWPSIPDKNYLESIGVKK